MRHALTAAIAIATLTLLAGGCGGGDVGKRTPAGFVPWRLIAVSPDARTLTIEHEEPFCDEAADRASVRETDRSVEISVRKFNVEIAKGMGCTLELRIERERVQLREPLARRKLSQPGQPLATPMAFEGSGDHPGAAECARINHYPPGAAARQVPWLARRARYCTAPLPSAARRLPILRRRANTNDRLPQALLSGIDESDLVLRPREARRLSRGAPVWFVPGPGVSCFGRIRMSHGVLTGCRPTQQIARRGAYATARCLHGTPKYATLIGFVPAGVDSVQLTSRGSAPRSVRVRGGGWLARTPYPARIEYGDVRFVTDYDTRACIH